MFGFLFNHNINDFNCMVSGHLIELVVPILLPSIGELASSPTIRHDLRVVYTQILIG